MKKGRITWGGIVFFACFLIIVSCARTPEYSREELEKLKVEGIAELLAKTQSKPWKGEDFVPGRPGGTWSSGITAEPKSFNLLIAERDAETLAIVGSLHEYLLSYDPVNRRWEPKCAFPEIVVDEEKGTLKVIYTLRDNLYWSYYNSDKKIPVTSDDVVFWYNEIEGDQAFHSSAYNSQFITLANGESAHVDIEKIDEKRFSFNFPRIDANPLLSTNCQFGPSFIYAKAKEEGGVQKVLDLFSIASDPKEIPSMGQWFITEYVPGLRLVFHRNPDYWEKDSAGTSLPYIEKNIVQILPDKGTQFLVFKEGGVEAYGALPEDLDDLINNNKGNYSVFNDEGSLGAALWSFNQNPKMKDAPWYEWFIQKEFRQAMSSILNRDRIITQVYRGLAEPKFDFFASANPYYNPDIKLKYVYNPETAIDILASIGIKQDNAGIMRDEKGQAIEFDLSIPADATTYSDTASILMDEAAKIGIKINIRATDFQKLVNQLSGTYDWSSIFIGLGINFWPTQGSNVWPSSGNLHLWHPLQEKPATEWEARVDELYNEGSFTIDRENAQKIWDEYQSIILEQCPVIYLMRPRSFYAILNRWDLTNFYYDNLKAALTSYLFLK